MRQLGPCTRALVLALFGSAAYPGAEPATAVPAAAPAASANVVKVRFRSRARGEVARKAVSGAVRRLASDECRALLADFQDASGVQLDARLEASGASLEQWIGGVYFYEGTAERSCDRRGVMAVTQVGSHVVYLCPAFVEQQHRDPGLAEALVIHELLHTMGLAENPPTSLEINRRVFERCGR